MLRTTFGVLICIGSACLLAGCRGGSAVASRPQWPSEASGHDPTMAPNDERLAENHRVDHPTPYGRQEAARPTSEGFRPGSIPAPGGREAAGFDAVAEHLAQARNENAKGNLEQAKLHYRRVLQDVPNHHEAHHRMAVIADKQQNFAEAETHYRAALRVRPNDADVQSDLGYSYLLQGKDRESEQALNQALQIDPNHVRANNNLGLLYGRQGQYEMAFEAFRRTSSEAEARQKLTKLFPNADPGPVIARSSDPRAPDPRSAASGSPATIDAASYLAQESPPAGRSVSETSAGPVPRSTANDLTMRIKADMERARLEAETARQQNTRPGEPRLRGSRTGQEVPSKREGFSVAQSSSAAPGFPSPTMGHGAMGETGAPLPSRYRRNVPDAELSRRIAEVDDADAGPRRPSAPSRNDRNGPMPRPSGAAPAPTVHFVGRERRVANGPDTSGNRPTPNNHSTYDVDGNDVWPPRDQIPSGAEKIMPVHYSSAPQDVSNRSAPYGRVPAVPPGAPPNMTAEEAQRMATRIALEAGPGGMWNYLDRSENSPPAGSPSDGRPGPANGGYPNPGATGPSATQLRSAGAGYMPDLTSPPSSATWNGSGEGMPGPGAQRDPRQLPAMGPTWNSDPRGVMQAGGQSPMGDPRWAHRAGRETGVVPQDESTMPPDEPSAVNMSYQDHMNQMGPADGMAPDEREYQAILQEIKQNQRMPQGAYSQIPVIGQDSPAGSGQYYSPMDSQQQVYENMRAASREGYQARSGQTQNPTGMHDGLRPPDRSGAYGMEARGGNFGQPTGVSPWNAPRR